MHICFWVNFTVESDHKSLEQILLKDLADAPAHLQHMLLHLQDYDFTIKDRPATDVAVADTLSRYSPRDAPEIKLDVSLNHININAEKKLDYQAAVWDDPLLHALTDMIISGWLDNIRDVPKALHPYHTHCDVLTIEDRIIL